MLEHVGDLVCSCLGDVPAAEVTQGDVEDGAVLGGVDVLAAEHGVAELLDACLLRERQEGLEDLLVDQVLGVV